MEDRLKANCWECGEKPWVGDPRREGPAIYRAARDDGKGPWSVYCDACGHEEHARDCDTLIANWSYRPEAS